MDRVDKFAKDPKKALLKLSAPIVIAMLVQTLYSVVDTAFVGRLGPASIAALTFSFPVFFILISINSGISTGMSALIARFMGEKNKGMAENAATHGLLISVILAILFFVLGNLTLNRLLVLFGAEPAVITLATEYLRIIFLGIFLMFPAYVYNSIFSAQGDTKTPMKVQIISLVANIILDPIFIYVLGYGVKGAAIATVISFGISFFLYLYYIHKKSYLCITYKCFNYTKKLIYDILRIGFPASLVMLLTSIYVIFINRYMAHFGTNYVASFGIITRLESVAVMPIIALSIALLTLVGMFYGAKRFDLLKNILKYALKIGLLYTTLLGIIFYFFPYFFLKIFTTEAEILAISIPYLRIDLLTFPFMTIGITASRTLQAMGLGFPGLLINLTRVVIFAIPLGWLFVFTFGYGYLSVAWAMVAGGFASTIVAYLWMRAKVFRL